MGNNLKEKLYFNREKIKREFQRFVDKNKELFDGEHTFDDIITAIQTELKQTLNEAKEFIQKQKDFIEKYNLLLKKRKELVEKINDLQ